MRIDITYAGLTEQMLQRLKLAAHLLASQQIQASVRAWDGTRCQALVILAQDGYGEHAQEIAQRRGTPTLALSTTLSHANKGVRHIAADSLAGAIAIALHKMIDNADAAVAPETTRTSARQSKDPTKPTCELQAAEMLAISSQALVRLASDPALKGQTIQASAHGRTVTLRLADARVYATSMSDLHATSYLLCTDGWDLRVTTPGVTSPNCGEVTLSLDAYFLNGALHSPQKLPPFPQGSYWLEDWPDLGSTPQLIDTLRITQVLLRGPISAQELGVTCGLDIAEVSACLWAFLAAGLLRGAQNQPLPAIPMSPPPVRPLSGLLGRIASRFGLSTLLAKGRDAT